jgi:hypothetical protein
VLVLLSVFSCGFQTFVASKLPHWFAEAGYRSQDEIDMFAINLTVVTIGAYLAHC